MSMIVLKQGDTRDAVRFLQRDLNERAAPRGLPLVQVDGNLGPDTMRSVQRVGRALGALESTLATARDRGEVSIGLQRLIRWPENRTEAQLKRARDRKRADDQAGDGPAAAIRWAAQWVGRTEQPPGSNRGPWGLTEWQEDLGSWLVGQAWCGVYVGTALSRAGVDGINYRVASVRFIYDDAGAGRNGFLRRVPLADARPGDAVGLFGLSTHVELLEKRVPGGFQLLGGNTSRAGQGSANAGGGVYRNVRPFSQVVYVARPRWS